MARVHTLIIVIIIVDRVWRGVNQVHKTKPHTPTRPRRGLCIRAGFRLDKQKLKGKDKERESPPSLFKTENEKNHMQEMDVYASKEIRMQDSNANG